MIVITSLLRYVPVLQRFKKSRMGLIGLIIVLGWGIIALSAPILSPKGPYLQSDDYLLTPSHEHLSGTDHLGRDVFDRTIWGSRISFIFAFGVAGLSVIIGVVLGAIPGYYGGRVDDVISRSFEAFLVIPRILLLILVAAMFGSNIFLMMMFVGMVIWPTNAKITRSQVLSIKNRVYVKAARASGVGAFGLLTGHILPNGLYPVIANSALEMGLAILLEASLSFLGLGDPNLPSWGQIIFGGRLYLTSWWVSILPGIAITSLVLGFNFLGDGLNYILNPRFQTRKA